MGDTNELLQSYQYVHEVESARKQQANGKRMQMQSLLLFLIILTSLIVAPRVNAIYQSSSKPSIRPSYRTALRPEIDGLQNSALIIISNDGPTVLGSKTVFNIAVIAPPGFYLSFQWGTFIPYIWKTVRTYKYTERLEVNWWKSTGLKKVNFYIDALKPNASSWTRIAQNSSSIQVNGMVNVSFGIITFTPICRMYYP